VGGSCNNGIPSASLKLWAKQQLGIQRVKP
jgi:hypothetical protein